MGNLTSKRVKKTGKVQEKKKKKTREDLFPDEESDNDSRLCNIYLRAEPARPKFMERYILISPSFKHWSVIFDFNDRIIQCHVYNLAEGPLIGGEMCPQWNATVLKPKDYFLGQLIVSPKAMHQLASQHYLNGQEFHVTRRNCQVWALELLEKLDPQLCQKVSREHHLRPMKDRRIKFLVVKVAEKYFNANRN